MSVWNRHILTQKRQMPGFYKFFKVSPTFFTFIKMCVYPRRRLAVCVIYCDTLFFLPLSIYPSILRTSALQGTVRWLFVRLDFGRFSPISPVVLHRCHTLVPHWPSDNVISNTHAFSPFPIHSKLRLLEKRLLVIDYFQKRAWNAAEYLCLWSCKM